MDERKFSQFVPGGEIRRGDIVVGLRPTGVNKDYQFDFPGLGIQDANGNYMLQYDTVGASAVNFPKLINALTGAHIIYGAAGSDSDIGIWLLPKGSGGIKLDSLNWLTSDSLPGDVVSTDGAGNLVWISGMGMIWTEITALTQLMSPNNGYIPNNGALVTLTLPVTAAVGTMLKIVGKGVGGWQIAQNAGQSMQLGSASATTTGVAGSIASTNRYDSCEWICTTANTIWTASVAPQSSGLTIV